MRSCGRELINRVRPPPPGEEGVRGPGWSGSIRRIATSRAELARRHY